MDNNDNNIVGAKEQTLRIVISGLQQAVNNLESKVFGERSQGTGKPAELPPSQSILRESMRVLEGLEKRIRKASDELPL